MKRLIFLLFIVVILAISSHAQDPNEPVKPPAPGDEVITIIDSATLRVTTSIDIKKEHLLFEKQRLIRKRREINDRLAIIDARLALFK